MRDCRCESTTLKAIRCESTTLEIITPPYNFNEGESNGLMPFGGGVKVFLIKLWLSYYKDYYPSPKALPSTLPQGEGYLVSKNSLWQQGASAT